MSKQKKPGTFALGNPGGPGHLGKAKGKPHIQQHLRNTLLGAMQEVCDDPLVMQSVVQGLKHFALTNPVDFTEWWHRVLGTQLNIDQKSETVVRLTFLKAEKPKGWVKNQLDVIDVDVEVDVKGDG